MILAYKACDRSGRQIADTIEAHDSDVASEALRRKGLYVIEISENRQGATGAKRSSAGRMSSRKLKDLAVFTRQLAVLVSSGTQVVQSLGALERQVGEGPWRETIASIRGRVEEGEPLSQAMEAYSEYFDATYCSLVAAGESSGNLVEMLERLATLKQKQLKVRNTVIGAMVYPSLLIVLAVGVLVLLLTFVVPRFAGLFETLDVPLPTSTRVLVVLGEVFRSYWWALIGSVVAVTVGVRAWMRTPAGTRTCHTVILQLPQFGRIAKSFSTARITRLLGVLMEGRVPILDAMRLTRNAVKNVNYQDLIAKAEDLVARGEPIFSAFSDEWLISPSVCEAIRSGEQSGQLGKLLLTISDFLDEENDVVLRSLTSIIEPVILIVMGALVGLVAVSLFLPLFDLTSMTQGGG